MSNMVNKNANSMKSSIPQNSEGNSGGQVLSSKNTISSCKQQWVQDAEQYEYKQRLQNQLLKPNCNPRNILHSVIKTEIPSREQQLILSQRQHSVMQPSSFMQPSMMQSAPSSAFHQNPQQTPIIDEKGKQKLQQPILPLRQHFSNASNLQDVDNSSSNMYLSGHQNNASSLSGQFGNSSMYNSEKRIYRGPQAEVMVQQQLYQMDANSPPHSEQLLHQIQVQQANLQSQPNPLQQGCTSQISHTDEDDWKEKLYQKIQTMKDLHATDLKETFKIASSIIHEMDSVPQHPNMAEYEKFKALGITCKKSYCLLHLPKAQMSPSVERSLHQFEGFANSILQRFKRKRSIFSLQQGQPPPREVHSKQRLQQQFQNPEMHLNGNQTNTLLQSMGLHPLVTETEKKANTTIEDSTVSSQGPTSLKNMMNSQQPGDNLDAKQGNVVGSLLQNPGKTSQSYSSSKSVSNAPQRRINHLELSSNMSCLLQQNEQQMIKSQLAKRQPQQRQMTKQSVQQTEAHQIRHLHLNDANNMKVGLGIGFKEGSFLQNCSPGKLSLRNPHILSSGPPPQLIQASSPQVPQLYTPQVDHKILHMPLANSGRHLNSPNSMSVGSSPSTSVSPSLIKEDSNKLTSAVSSLPIFVNVELKGSPSKPALNSAYVISTPGLSPSYLLGESDVLDGTQIQVSTTDFCESRLTEEPIQCLVKRVRSLSNKSLSASISDMESVVRLVDRAAASKPGIGSRSAIGVDLAGVANSFLQGEKLDWSSRKMTMRHCIGVIQSNICASSSKTDSFQQLNNPEKCEESTATSPNKRPRCEVKCTLAQEIREINQRLLDTFVDISERDNYTCGTAATEGTFVRCSFNAMTINPDMTSDHASAIMSLFSPLLLLVPRNYPDCSPILVDKLPEEVSAGCEDLLRKAKSKLCAIMRNLLQPMSVGEIAKSWDVCVREVIADYAQQNGGGSFSSTYGTWEKHLSSANGTWEKHLI